MSRRQDASTLEQQNDAQLDELHSKIRALHHVTVDIHNDSRSQNTLLDGTSNAFESIGNSITNSASRLGRNISSQQSQYKTIGYAIAAVAGLYFVWKVVL